MFGIHGSQHNDIDHYFESEPPDDAPPLAEWAAAHGISDAIPHNDWAWNPDLAMWVPYGEENGLDSHADLVFSDKWSKVYHFGPGYVFLQWDGAPHESEFVVSYFAAPMTEAEIAEEAACFGQEEWTDHLVGFATGGFEEDTDGVSGQLVAAWNDLDGNSSVEVHQTESGTFEIRILDRPSLVYKAPTWEAVEAMWEEQLKDIWPFGGKV